MSVMLRTKLFDFLMGTVFSTFAYYYTNVTKTLKFLKSPSLPLRIDSVRIYNNNSSKDMTKEYLKDNKFGAKYLENEYNIVHVDWSFNDINYSYSYSIDDPIQFPPYTIEQLRTLKPSSRIAALSVDDDASVFETVRRYAGPMHDFYGKTVNLEHILQKSVSSVKLIDSKGKFHAFKGPIMRFNS